MQQGDYSSYYNQTPNPNPNPIDHNHASYASAPPFSDYPPYPPPNYPSFSQNPNPPLPSPTTPQSNPSDFSSHIPYNPPPPTTTHQPYYPPFDHHQTPSITPPAPDYTSFNYTAPYNPTQIGSGPGLYDNNSVKLGQGIGYLDDKYGGYNPSGLNSVSDPYGKRPESGYDLGYDNGYGDGVYAYEGNKKEPYGARGTAPKSSTWSGFDDYGRPINFPSEKESLGGGGGGGGGAGSTKIVRAVPKAETQEDVKGGVQKFRVKLLAETGGQTTVDVLCQVGLDGIRMLDPSTSRMLRIYPLENITRCDVLDSSIFAFWSKSTVDIEPRRIRLKSNSYTTNTLLDTVTAAIVQFKEMGGNKRLPDSVKTTEQPTEKKKGIADWMNFIKPGNEEKDHWVPDEAVSKCTGCGSDFSAFNRKHHCRNCGDIFCDKCTQGRTVLTAEENAQPVRVCDRCLAEVTHRLSTAKEATSRPVGLQSHEDLARQLKEELERNRKGSSGGSKTDGSGRRMREVACPTCTVHLQVQVPSSGSETIECGVCQHPFLVSSH